jgi:hypothetical protein
MALSGKKLTFTRIGLGVEISMVFEIFGHFLFQRMEPPRNVMNYIPSDETRTCMI